MAGFLFYLGTWEETKDGSAERPDHAFERGQPELRDFYPSLDALCDDMDADKDALCKALSAVGYAYDAARNQFI